METADVIVLGLGPGGEDVAGRLAEAGLDVVGIEAELVGGECPYWGCVPSKMMIRAADALAEARRVDGLAGHATVTPDWGPVAQRIRAEATDTWDDTVAADRFTGKGGRLVRGRGRIVGPRSVEVAGTTYVASRALVVNTGSAPSIPPIPGLAGTPYWTNRGAIQAEDGPRLARRPRRGGHRSRARAGVCALRVSGHGRRGRRPGARRWRSLRRQPWCPQRSIGDGIDVRVGVRALGVSHDGATFSVKTDAGDIRGERLLVATGRRSDLAALGADALGVDVDAEGTPDGRAVPGRRRRLCDRRRHRARALSPTCRCTRRTIVVRDILGDNGLMTPDTARCLG